MSKTEFLSQLSHKLRALPESEQQDALEYYEGYISDAEDEAAAIRDLGSPGEVAATILSNYVSQRPMAYSSRPPKRGGRFKTAHIALLAVFALPIGLPLAMTALGLIIGLLAIIFSVVITGIALLIAGAVTLVYSPFVLVNDFWFGIMTGGMGLVALGLGILVFKGSAKLVSGFPAILRMIRRRGHYSDAVKPGQDSHHQSWPENSNDKPKMTALPSSSSENSSFDDPQYANSMPLSSQECHETPATMVKRRIRVFRLAMVMIFLGAVMFGLAWHSGARGGSLSWHGGRFNIQVGHHGEQIHQPFEESFHSVYIRATNANVVILPSTTARASYTGTPNVDISIRDGVLTINQNAAGTRTLYLMDFNFSPGSSREIRLYLPSGFYTQDGEIDIRTTSGRIQVEGNFANLNATATSGRIEVANNRGQAHTISLRTTSGRIAVENIRYLEYLNAHASSGRIEVNNISSNVNAANIRTTSGRISFKNAPYVEMLTLQASSGRIDLNNTSWATLDARTTSGRIEVRQGRIVLTPGQVSNTNLTATSGRISLNVANNRDDFRLGLTATSGRITVDGTNLANRGLINMGSAENIINVRTTSGRISVDFGG